MLIFKAKLLNITKAIDHIQMDGTVKKESAKLQLLTEISIPFEKVPLYQDKVGEKVSVEVVLRRKDYPFPYV